MCHNVCQLVDYTAALLTMHAVSSMTFVFVAKINKSVLFNESPGMCQHDQS